MRTEGKLLKQWIRSPLCTIPALRKGGDEGLWIIGDAVGPGVQANNQFVDRFSSCLSSSASTDLAEARDFRESGPVSDFGCVKLRGTTAPPSTGGITLQVTVGRTI